VAQGRGWGAEKRSIARKNSGTVDSSFIPMTSASLCVLRKTFIEQTVACYDSGSSVTLLTSPTGVACFRATGDPGRESFRIMKNPRQASPSIDLQIELLFSYGMQNHTMLFMDRPGFLDSQLT
jgi:hypothetical protein